MRSENSAEIIHLAKDGEKLIRCVNGDLPSIVDQAEAALRSSDAPVFSRGEALVTPVMTSVPGSDGRVFRSPKLLFVSVTWLIERLTRLVPFVKFDRRSGKWRRIDCPVSVAQTLLARGRWQLPGLAGLLPAPTLHGDGTPLESEGYDPRSRLFLDFYGQRFPDLPEYPAREDARKALEDILEVFATFSAVSEVDRSVIVSALLTALVRRSLPTAPLHAVTAHTAGSGKSMLVDVIATIATGRHCPVTALGRSPEEFEKRLGATLLEGDALISIDNVEQPLGGDFLCQVLTQQTVKVRVLGQSRTIETPTSATIFATGNNLRVSGDLTRRCLFIRLSPGCENPETQRFERDAVEYALSRRGPLVVAGLTIMRAYALAGRPDPSPPLGSFAAWSGMVRDAIVWSGGADPVASIDQARASDPEREALRAVMWAWHASFEDVPQTVAAAIDRSAPSKELRLALEAVAGEHGAINAKRLGKWLAKHNDRLLDGARFRRAGDLRGVATWRLEGFAGLEGLNSIPTRECQ